MQIKTERKLNPLRYYLSDDAKKRLRWMYVIYYECDNNITIASNKIGISREWLSKIKFVFEQNNKDPRSLEPESKAPHNTDNRKRISKDIEDKIIEIRDKYYWGKIPISIVLKRDYKMRASPSTVNRYLLKHLKINPKISERNKKAWAEKQIRDELKTNHIIKIKYRPPSKLKDYKPGALIEKDMKLIPTINKKPLNKGNKFHIKDFYNYQHTFIDTFTRVRGLELSEEPDSISAKIAYDKIKKRLPFQIACVNTDNGGENEKYFKKQTNQDEIIHFYSRASSPTDNPRVERSHLTDDNEFWKKGNNYRTFQKQKTALSKWEYIYNHLRPNQALGYLTPIEFYKLWKKNSKKAYQIKDKYKRYLAKQRKRLYNSRKMKQKNQIENLMRFIDAKLEQNNENKATKIDLKPYKLELTKCELCSWT